MDKKRVETEFNYSLLENGLDFIYSAVKNISELNDNCLLKSEHKNRIIKYVVLHLYSGIELVLKNILFAVHWSFVFADLDKAERSLLETGNFISIGGKGLIKRLENLCSIKLTSNEAKALEGLRNKRNRIEHFNIKENSFSVESSINKCVALLVRVLNEYYDIDKMNVAEKELLQKICVLLGKTQKHYDDAIIIANRVLVELRRQYDENLIVMNCPSCGEGFLVKKPDEETKCIFCGYEPSAEEVADCYINDIMQFLGYEYKRNPLFECHECGQETLVLDYENGKAICFSCNFEFDIKNFKRCNECLQPFYVDGDSKYKSYISDDELCFEEFDFDVCPTCIENKIAKYE